MGAWVPGRAVPWGLGRLPWAPGAHPRGSQGGVPAPNNKDNFRSLPVTFTCRPFGFASKFMSILMSIFGRFGVDLGPLLGVIFDHVGAFFGPSWSQNRLRTVLSSKKRLFTKHYVLPILFGQNGPQDGANIDPRSLQDGSKIVLDRFFSS